MESKFTEDLVIRGTEDLVISHTPFGFRVNTNLFNQDSYNIGNL